MKWFVFCKSDLLLKLDSDGTYTIPSGNEPPVPTKPWTNVMIVTPMEDGEEVRAFSIDSPVVGMKDYEMCPLRQSYYKLPAPLYLKAGKCQELLFWDSNTKYCGVCGGPMAMSTEISKKCTMCGKEIWPSPAIAVITLIKRDDKALLVQAKNFRTDHYGLVAGFVELGETLEEAARREIIEETGIEVGELKYIASQPWPYPCGLMVGFMTDYKSGEICLQRSELKDGQWFDKDHLPKLPEKLSIARWLIDNWLNEKV